MNITHELNELATDAIDALRDLAKSQLTAENRKRWAKEFTKVQDKIEQLHTASKAFDSVAKEIQDCKEISNERYAEQSIKRHMAQAAYWEGSSNAFDHVQHLMKRGGLI